MLVFAISYIPCLVVAQDNCYYVENLNFSNGTSCEYGDLFFTSSINTIVIGNISGIQSVDIYPTDNFSITIKPDIDNRNKGGTTIRTGGSVPGIDKKSSYVGKWISSENENILIIKQNPVHEFLDFYLNGEEISECHIYNSAGGLVLQKKQVNHSEVRLPLTKITQGSYTLVVTSSSKKTFTKIFIKK